ncbi:hypothetical protein BSG1_07926 [Bacillus sp. SG-1]|nr:hypothetical protein BSG1_07926 [Bacillus sp. SG-1]
MNTEMNLLVPASFLQAGVSFLEDGEDGSGCADLTLPLSLS